MHRTRLAAGQPTRCQPSMLRALPLLSRAQLPTKGMEPQRRRRLKRVAVGANVLGHVRNERESRVRRREGRHVLAAIWRKAEAVEAGHDEALGRREEAEEADHRETTVVDLGEERLLLALGRELLGE